MANPATPHAAPAASAPPEEVGREPARVVEDHEDKERWAGLAPADAGVDAGSGRRRRSRVFRDNERPRRPLRSTQEAKAVAARRKEQITGAPERTAALSPDSSPDSRPAGEAGLPQPDPGGDASSGAPTIRAPGADGRSEDPSEAGGSGGDGAQPNGRDAAAQTAGVEERNGSAVVPGGPPAADDPGSTPDVDINGSGLAPLEDSANGSPPVAAKRRGDAGDDESRRRVLRRRGRNRRKSGEA